MTESQVLLLLQIPLAGVVVFVVVLFLRHMRETTDKYMVAQESTIDKFMAAQASMLDKFMVAIKEQREMNAKSLKEVTEQIAGLNELIIEKLGDMEVSKAIQAAKEK
jgi:hypothetical protein